MISSISSLAVENGPVTLVDQIEHMIDARDAIWKRVQTAATPTMRELNELRVANDALEPMLTLEGGPTTPVLSPGRARIELTRCNLCRVLIARIEHEIAARQDAPAGLASARSAAHAFLQSSYA